MEWVIAEGDGCTFWFDVWRGINVRMCCDAHDAAYAVGYTFYDWVRANQALIQCGIERGVWDWAILAGIGVFSPVGAWFYFMGKKRDGRSDQAHL